MMKGVLSHGKFCDIRLDIVLSLDFLLLRYNRRLGILGLQMKLCCSAVHMDVCCHDAKLIVSEKNPKRSHH
jgi:hypothetical protein